MRTRLWITTIISVFLAGTADVRAEEIRSETQIRPAVAVKKVPTKWVSNPRLKVEAYKYSWKKSFEWEALNRSEVEWKAMVKNNNLEPRHICITYEFLDEDNLPVFSNGKCQVVRGQSASEIVGTIMVKSHLLEEVKADNIVPLEAHRLHSFVRPPKPK